MQTVRRSHLVPYSAEQMYQLADDIDDYKNFITWCSKSEEHERTADSVSATLAIAVQGMEKSFTTRNKLTPHSLIELELVDGPFDKLNGYWKFIEMDEGCKVDFELSFEISNKILAIFIGPMFEKAANTMLDVFIEQAEKKYATDKS